MGIGISRILRIAFACVLVHAPAFALDRDQTITQFYHTAWTVRDGAPGQISALAQTRDGYVWVAAAASLYRFDGVRFERYQGIGDERLPFGSISALKAFDDGLWIGFQFGGASLLKDGTLRNFDEQEGIPAGTVFGFAVDHDSTTAWAATARALVRFDGTRWEKIGAEWDYRADGAKAVFFDRNGVLWVSTGETLLTLAPGERKFKSTGLRAGWIVQMTEAPDGTLWAADAFGAVQPVALPNGGAPAHATSIHVESGGLLFDRDGSLWIGSLGDGVRRIPYPERLGDQRIERFDTATEIFTHADGMTADYVWPVLEDREGSIWFGTSGGLDRFRRGSMVAAEFPDGSHDLALVADNDGAVWAGTTNRPLMRLDGKTVTTKDGATRTTSAYRAADGTVWLGGRQGIWHVSDGVPIHVADPPSDVPDSDVQTMVVDRTGALWVAITGNGLFRLAGGVWTRQDDPALPLNTAGKPQTPLIAMSDAGARLWFGYTRNRIATVDGETIRVLSDADGLDLGNVTALTQGARTIWAGGEHGLAYFDGKRFNTLVVEGSEPLRGVVGIIEMANGDLWLHGVPGVFRIAASEIERAMSDASYRMRYRLFDFLDGLPARPTQLRPLPTAIRSADGRLWFATSNGAVWIDPTHIPTNPLPPPVTIESISAGGRVYPAVSNIELPERTTQLAIDYTALSLAVPERVRFRYRLRDIDSEWQDAGARRQAIYTNLGPGRYDFQVVAANDAGVWNDAGATVGFAIEPAYHQTWWFRSLYLLAGVLAIWLVGYLRMRQTLARMRERFEERHLERERIARDLHDTLLQSIQGLILRFQAVAEQMTAGSAPRIAMDKALDRADGVLVESRDRLRDLRSSIESGGDLGQAFSSVGQQLLEDGNTEFRVVVEGAPQPLDPGISDEIFRIGSEALINAFQHAGASEIETEIAFEPDALRVRIRDDGRGIASEILDAGGRPGHWGLPGMRERAAKIGAQLRIWGGSGSGTEVELRVPASVAYVGAPALSWRQLLRRIAGAGR